MMTIPAIAVQKQQPKHQETLQLKLTKSGIMYLPETITPKSQKSTQKLFLIIFMMDFYPW